MNDFRFYAPTEVVFGKNAEDKTGEYAAKYGTRALLVYGKGSVIKSGLLERVSRSLKNAGVEFCEFGGAQPNPTLAHAEEGVEKAVGFGADLIIGVGGGSAIDTAKAIAHGAANPGVPLWDIWTRKVPLCRSLPVAAVLTMPAAGSEMSDSAVLTNEALGKKAGINTDFNRCRFAITDPALGATLPKYQLAAGITDIMMHTMERYFTNGGNMEITDALAEGLLRTVMRNAEILVRDPQNYDARAEIMWAGSLSHNGLTGCGSDGGDWMPHKLEHELGGLYDVAHGAGLAAIWGSWARYVCKSCLPRFKQFAVNVMGVEPAGPDEETALKGIEAMEDFFRRIHMPTNLRELGVSASEDELAAMTHKCAVAVGGAKGSARLLREADMLAIYRASL